MSNPADTPACPIDTSTAAFAHDPLPGYARLRAEFPVSWQPPVRSWLLTRHADVARALREPALAPTGIARSWVRLKEKYHRDFPSVPAVFEYMPFTHSGRRHAELRQCFARAIAPRADRRRLFVSHVERLLARARRDGGFDLAEDFSNRLLFDVMCDLSEIAADDRSILIPLSHLSWGVESTLSLREREFVGRIFDLSREFLAREIAAQLARGSQSLIADIHHALPAKTEDKISATSAVLMAMLVMGNDALGGSVLFGVQKMLGDNERGHPRAVRQEDWGRVVDDVFRYTATVDFVTRQLTRDLVVGGQFLRAGDRVMVSPLSANHDSEEFGPTAGSIDVDHKMGVGMAFGGGRHLCVGMRMARNLGADALAGLANLPAIRMTGEARHAQGKVVRTLASMPVALS